MKKIVVLTGAGMSAESGINTFRDANGLWEGHDVMQVASPQGWYENQDLVLDFYNQRRKQLFEVEPNKGHMLLAGLEAEFEVEIITQNVDNLHERAGSSKVVHLHGELLKARSTMDESLVYDWEKDLITGDLCELGSQLRPHIVWFGEAVPLLDIAAESTSQADVLVIIGTSMQVYPAASLINYVQENTPIYFIDPKPAISGHQFDNLTVISEMAGTGVSKMIEMISQ
ncbi:SIR2 family NAD-dependent protein deacylase [Lutimonas zeaxanthinifaciens]|uniref:SIR2 family NAD-dependent protein deacylase n=1 Tax=Lutimonas zeaxanthinifaciens TaxID=3060215 RepID=UPI00265D3D84|nr:NAD-dependent deacylase [Lutimonas sp. YSD2104]WKK67297.1 NAD-dependent deacylase [Lutimonas sp. YSD2104]